MRRKGVTSDNFEKLDLFIQEHLNETDGLMPILWLHSIGSTEVYI